jgi:hypothetical protein
MCAWCACEINGQGCCSLVRDRRWQTANLPLNINNLFVVDIGGINYKSLRIVKRPWYKGSVLCAA